MQKTGGHPFSVTNHRSWQTLPGLLWTFGDLQRYDLSESVGLVCSPMMMVSSHGFSHGFSPSSVRYAHGDSPWLGPANLFQPGQGCCSSGCRIHRAGINGPFIKAGGPKLVGRSCGKPIAHTQIGHRYLAALAAHSRWSQTFGGPFRSIPISVTRTLSWASPRWICHRAWCLVSECS